MYGYTPPAVIAIDAELLRDCGAYQAVAGALAAQMRHRPVWAVVSNPVELSALSADEQADMLAACYRDPRDAPTQVDDPHAAVAEALAHHLSEQGTPLTVRRAPIEPPGHSPPSSLVIGSWRDAADVAKTLAASEVLAWALEPEHVPVRVAGVPFRASLPEAAMRDWSGN